MDSSFEQRFLSLCVLAACEKSCKRGRRDGRPCHRPLPVPFCDTRVPQKPRLVRRAAA
jgi:hypothetical protein